MLKELLDFSSARHNLISETMRNIQKNLKLDFKSDLKICNQIKHFNQLLDIGNWWRTLREKV